MIRSFRAVFACAMALALACSGEPAAPPGEGATDEPASDAERVAACEVRTARLAQTLASLPASGPIVPVPAGLEAPETSSGLVVTTSAPTVTVRAAGGLELDGRALADAAALGTDLATLRRHWSLVEPTTAYPAVIHVWASREVTLAALRERLSAAADHRIVVLAVDRAPRAAAPRCPPSLGDTCARLPRLAARQRSAELQLAWWSAADDCASLRALSASITGAASTDRARVMRDELPDAVRACECAADVDAIEYVASVALASPFDPPVRALELPLPGPADEITTVGAWAGSMGEAPAAP